MVCSLSPYAFQAPRCEAHLSNQLASASRQSFDKHCADHVLVALYQAAAIVTEVVVGEE